MKNISVVRLIRSVILLFAIGAASLMAGCSDPAAEAARAEFQRLPVVMSGTGPWGDVDLRQAADGSVTGQVPWGDAKISRTGDRYAGSSAWGDVALTFKDDSLTGEAPWGQVSVKVTDYRLTGELPWGKVDLTLQGQTITGSLPWGDATLKLGGDHHSLTDPVVLQALTALLADKT